MYYHIACRKYIFQLMIVKCHPYVGKDEDALQAKQSANLVVTHVLSEFIHRPWIRTTGGR
jgi:hypothetical protein